MDIKSKLLMSFVASHKLQCVLKFICFSPFYLLSIQEQIVKGTVRVRRCSEPAILRIKVFMFSGNTVLIVPLGKKMKGNLKLMVKTKENKLLEASCEEKRNIKRKK